MVVLHCRLSAAITQPGPSSLPVPDSVVTVLSAECKGQHTAPAHMPREVEGKGGGWKGRNGAYARAYAVCAYATYMMECVRGGGVGLQVRERRLTSLSA